MLERTIRLEFSGWTPRPVIAVASQMCIEEKQEDPQILTDECRAEFQRTILRLANDLPMKSVYRWLTRKDVEVNDEAARLLWREAFSDMPEPPWPVKEIALGAFFSSVCQWAIFFLLFNPALIEAFRRQAQLWEGVAAQCSSSGEQKPRGKGPNSLTVNFPPLAQWDDPWASLDEKATVLQRNLGDPVRTRARMYVIKLTATTKLLYGKPMHSSLATVASVMLDLKGREQISRDDVRNWVSR
jgi:hypothetical protein